MSTNFWIVDALFETLQNLHERSIKRQHLQVSEWYCDQHATVYLRVGNTHDHGEFMLSVVISNIVVQDGQRHKGVFKELVNHLTAYCQQIGAKLLVIESINAPELLDSSWVRDQGFNPKDTQVVAPGVSFIKIIGDSNVHSN